MGSIGGPRALVVRWLSTQAEKIRLLPPPRGLLTGENRPALIAFAIKEARQIACSEVIEGHLGLSAFDPLRTLSGSIARD